MPASQAVYNFLTIGVRQLNFPMIQRRESNLSSLSVTSAFFGIGGPANGPGRFFFPPPTKSCGKLCAAGLGDDVIAGAGKNNEKR